MSDEWIRAADALKLVRTIASSYMAPRAICSRAYVGLIKAKAKRIIIGGIVHDDAEVPERFWWAEGEAALEQNWGTGDFETWINNQIEMRAYGVQFSRADIEELVGESDEAESSTIQSVVTGGRPPAAWWDDLWVEICRQLWEGDLKPEKQSDIEVAMLNWATAAGHDPALSTIRPRARKLWSALNQRDKN
jgi:hypothetical protein